LATALLVLPACSPAVDDAGATRRDQNERDRQERAAPDRREVVALVRRHAMAWEDGDTSLVNRILHPEARLAYPGRRLGKAEWIEDLAEFSRKHVDTRVYIHTVVVDGDQFAVEWQFAATERESGTRTAVGDAIIGSVRDGRIVEWKEYLDGRVPELQRQGRLPLDEGLEPFPWPSNR
jgi:ketosteroid isomerase-like protein